MNTETIKINGTTYTSTTWPSGGVSIPTNAAGQPTQPITLNPVDGGVTATILYKTIDNAGVESPSTGYEKLPFGVIGIAGNVFEDNNGETISSHLMSFLINFFYEQILSKENH